MLKLRDQKTNDELELTKEQLTAIKSLSIDRIRIEHILDAVNGARGMKEHSFAVVPEDNALLHKMYEFRDTIAEVKDEISSVVSELNGLKEQCKVLQNKVRELETEKKEAEQGYEELVNEIGIDL